jgi:hypothetical protein
VLKGYLRRAHEVHGGKDPADRAKGGRESNRGAHGQDGRYFIEREAEPVLSPNELILDLSLPK